MHNKLQLFFCLLSCILPLHHLTLQRNLKDKDKDKMKTETILFSIHGDERNVHTLCGHFTSSFDTRQVCSYSIEGGIATITAINPLITTRLALPLPLQVPVTDLGSGRLTGLTIDADTLIAAPTVCPRPDWAERRRMQPTSTTYQTLMADYIGLL